MAKFSALLLGAALSVTAQARLYNYQDLPVGERSFGMASASVAVPGDVGNMFYNPATLSYNEYTQFSASLASYARIDTRTGEYVSLFRSGLDNISRGGFVSIPSMVGGNLKAGPWVWGGAILVPFNYTNSGTLHPNATDAASFESKFDSVWLGMFLARKWGPWGLGLSLFYASTGNNEKFFFLTESTSPTEIRYVQTTWAVNGMAAVLGTTYELNEEWKMGLSLRPPALKFGGKGEYQNVSSGAGTNAPGTTFQTQSFPQPWRLSLGLSWAPTPKFLIATDLHFYSAFFGNLSPDHNPAFEVAAREVVNGSIGAEYMPWKWLGFRAGFFTNFSSAAHLTDSLSAINDKVHMFGSTAAVVFAQDTGTISLGGYVQGGQGSSKSIEAASAAPVPRSNYIYGFVIGSGYRF